MEWTTKTVIRLVREYRKRSQLWDHEHESYRVHSAKYEAWSELAEMFSCDIVDVRKKFNSLLASHRREKARVREGGRSTWFLYPHLAFLPGHIESPAPPDPENNQSQNTDVMEPEALERSAADSSDDTDAEEEEEEAIVVKHEPEATFQYITASTVPEAKTIKPKLYQTYAHRRTALKRKAAQPTIQTEEIDQEILEPNPNLGNLTNFNTSRDSLDLKIAEMIKLLRKTENCKKKDECDTFGEYIASSLRKHDDRTQSMIKQAINNILFEQEMKKYNTNGTYTVILADPIENPLGSVHLTDDK